MPYFSSYFLFFFEKNEGKYCLANTVITYFVVNLCSVKKHKNSRTHKGNIFEYIAITCIYARNVFRNFFIWRGTVET